MQGGSVKSSLVSSKFKSIPAAKPKAKPQKPVVATRFSYFVQCKHDLKHAATCPMCKLVGIVTRKHFDDEKERQERAHEQSLVNRAQLRLTLMMRWARCQSMMHNKFVPTPTFDIVFSKSLTSLLVDDDAVGSRPNPIDFDEVVKILNRRNRIQEVGHFAAIYLQSRIRKYLAKRYVRRLMLQRFEYVPATRRKDAFYVDNYWSRKWLRTPRYLMNEAPATPRTLSRRLAADDRVREKRFERYQQAMARQYKDMEDVWAQEETTVRFLKQLGVLRDVVRMAMLALTRNQLKRAAAQAAAERLAEARKLAAATPTGGGSTPAARRNSVMGRSAFAQLAAAEEANAAAQAAVPELQVETVDIPLHPVWVCLSAPACSARQLGLQLALATVPSPATGAVAVRTDGENGPRCSAAAATPTTGGMLKQGSDANKGAPYPVPVVMPAAGKPSGSTKTPKLGAASGLGSSTGSLMSISSTSGKQTARVQGSPGRSSTPSRGARKAITGGAGMITGAAQLQRALQFLETSIWSCLVCRTPEEVLSKLVLEDLRPVYESVMNITQEPKQIWRGGLGFAPRNDTPATAGGLGSGSIGVAGEGHFESEVTSLTSALGASASLDENASIGSLSLDDFDSDEYGYEVLPMTLQLRPHFAERGCNGFFRLFFYMDELVVVSACSPWAFYPEVLKNRDLINNSLRAYAALPATKAFIQHFLTRANVHTIGKSTMNADDPPPPTAAAPSRGIAAGQGSSKNARRGSVSAAPMVPASPAGGRRKAVSGIPPAIITTALLPVQQTGLSCLFTPPEELIFGNQVLDRAAIQRMRDIAQFSDEKTMLMAQKYSFMIRNTAFAERLKRAEHNLANRMKKRRAAAAAAPTKAFTDASPYHQHLAQLEQWRNSDPFLPLSMLNTPVIGEENNKELVKDLAAVQTDLIGHKLLTLLRGAEAQHEAESDTMNVFDARAAATTESSSVTEMPSRRGSMALVVHTEGSEESSVVADGEATGETEGGEPILALPASVMESSLHTSTNTSVTEETASIVSVSVEERNLSEYEAKLHRYSSKVRMEITERLRKPEDVPKVQELFPLVVMDVYVQLPGKAGFNTVGSSASLASAASGSVPGGGGLRRNPTDGSGGAGLSSVPSTPGSGAGSGGGGYGTTSLLGVDLQQVVGAFSCETDRPPPNLDCALSDWEHFYSLHQQRVAAQHPRTPGGGSLDAGGAWDSGSETSSFGPGPSRGMSSKHSASMASSSMSVKAGWTQTNNDTGVSTYLAPLPNGMTFQFHMLGGPPSKAYLERTLPKKVKEWLGLPV